MNTTIIKSALFAAKKTLGKYAPQIMVGAGIVGMGVTIGLTIKASLRTSDLADRKNQNDIYIDDPHGVFRDSADDNLREVEHAQNKKEFVREVSKQWIPVGLAFLTSASLLVAGNVVQAKRMAVLSTAYTALEASTSEAHKALMDSKPSENKDELTESEKTHAKVAEKFNPNEQGWAFYNNSCDSWWSFSTNAGRIHFLKGIEQTYNYRLHAGKFVCLNDIYREIGLEPTAYGQIHGWTKNDNISFGVDWSEAIKNCEHLDEEFLLRFNNRPENIIKLVF